MTEQELIHLLKHNTEKGLREVMALYGRAFKTICRNVLRGYANEDIEEAVSDILVAVWKAADRYDEAADSSFKSYCYGIARKCALKKRRECLKTGELLPFNEDLQEDVYDLEGMLERKEQRKILEEVLEDSQEPLRSIFILRYFYFFKVKEIARMLELSSKQVENHLYRGKDVLKKALLERGMEG